MSASTHTHAPLPSCWLGQQFQSQFYYRFPEGESGGDVYDRVSTFLESLFRQMTTRRRADNVVVVSHGLTNRLFLMRFFRLTVEHFEVRSLSLFVVGSVVWLRVSKTAITRPGCRLPGCFVVPSNNPVPRHRAPQPNNEKKKYQLIYNMSNASFVVLRKDPRDGRFYLEMGGEARRMFADMEALHPNMMEWFGIAPCSDY